MIVTLSLVYNIHCFSGVIFQFVAESVHRKKKATMDVLAAGGRYDHMVILRGVQPYHYFIHIETIFSRLQDPIRHETFKAVSTIGNSQKSKAVNVTASLVYKDCNDTRHSVNFVWKFEMLSF